jgi:hypothetical protein
MSDTILSGDFTVYYKSENRRQQIVWTGSTEDTRTVRELYSALMDLFDEANQMNEGIPMSAQTPTEYTLGRIEAVDTDSWFIDNETTKHLKGGSISSSSWSRIEGSNTGIVHINYEVGGGTNFVTTDQGKTVVHADGDTGTLLDYHIHLDGSLGVNIRPTNSAAANNWDSPGGTITVTGGTGSVTQLNPATSGNSLWASVFTLGTLASGTEIYIVQGFQKLNTWWLGGHIDILVHVQKLGEFIDFGLITIFAREYGRLFDHFTIDASQGGRNPVPLSTSSDVNNTTAEGTIAALTGITFTYGATEQDISDGSGNQPYDVLINCGGNSLNDFYEYTKYVTRRNAGEPLTTAYGRDGEQYLLVGELRISYDTQTANFFEGAILTGQTSGATGTIVADHDSDTSGTLVVKEVRGAFVVGEIIQDNQGTPGSATIATDGLEDTLISKTAPFGTFAGGRFFGARGVWITNMHANDANNYQILDSNNVNRTPPISVPISVDGLESGDRVAVFRTTGPTGDIDKTYLTSHASVNTTGSTTFTTQETIPNDTPASGRLRVVDKTDMSEQSYSYSSYAGSVFLGIVKLFGSEDPGLDRDYNDNDTVYVPYIEAVATGGSVSVGITYEADRSVLTRVRIKGILPYSIRGTLTNAGYSTTAIRNPDNIVK